MDKLYFYFIICAIFFFKILQIKLVFMHQFVIFEVTFKLFFIKVYIELCLILGVMMDWSWTIYFC